jgi:hypothetical protein
MKSIRRHTAMIPTPMTITTGTGIATSAPRIAAPAARRVRNSDPETIREISLAAEPAAVPVDNLVGEVILP